MMKKSYQFSFLPLRWLLAVCMCCSLLSSNAIAQVLGSELNADVDQGMVDKTFIEPSTFYSSSNTQISISDELKFKPGKNLDQDNFTAKAEFWSDGQWGVSGNIQENDVSLFGLPEESEFKRIDVNRKFLQGSETDSFIAIGFGLQSMNIQNQIESEGVNISVLGEYFFGRNLLLFGNGTLFQGFNQSLERDVSGYQLEAGLNYNLGSQLSFSAGLKVSDLEDQQFIRSQRSFSSSFLIGTSLAF